MAGNQYAFDELLLRISLRLIELSHERFQQLLLLWNVFWPVFGPAILEHLRLDLVDVPVGCCDSALGGLAEFRIEVTPRAFLARQLCLVSYFLDYGIDVTGSKRVRRPFDLHAVCELSLDLFFLEGIPADEFDVHVKHLVLR